jgi:hypothetical protein
MAHTTALITASALAAVFEHNRAEGKSDRDSEDDGE